MAAIADRLKNLVVSQEGSDVSRGASPQPSHISVPERSNGKRVLRSATVGYIAPEFHGKVEQMKTGQCFHLNHICYLLTFRSQGHYHAGRMDARVYR